MKVLFAGPYRDGTGYSHAAIEYILSLLETDDIDLVCRSVKMTNSKGEVPSIIDELERKSLDGVDKIFQYNLPLTYVKNGRAENIGGFAYETVGMPINGWIDGINQMDKIIVPCLTQKQNLEQYPIIPKVYTVPHSVDTSDEYYNQPKPNLDLPIDEGTTKFYTISEYSPRKNIEALLCAYFTAFSVSDNVVFIIKTHINGQSSSSSRNKIYEIINSIKSNLRAYADPEMYPKVIVTTDYISEKKIRSIHQHCDVFLSASHGEGWCLPFIDALNNGNMAIVPSFGAFLDHRNALHDKGVVFIDGVIAPCFGAANGLNLYTANEHWFNVNVNHFTMAMKELHNRFNSGSMSPDSLSEARTGYVKQHLNRKVVGQKLKEALLGD